MSYVSSLWALLSWFFTSVLTIASKKATCFQLIKKGPSWSHNCTPQNNSPGWYSSSKAGLEWMEMAGLEVTRSLRGLSKLALNKSENCGAYVLFCFVFFSKRLFCKSVIPSFSSPLPVSNPHSSFPSRAPSPHFSE